MDKLFGPILQGIPGAVVVAVAYLVTVQPMSTRVDQVVSIVNRELIPVINELKKERLPGPEIKPLAELSDKVTRIVSYLAAQERQINGMEVTLQNIVKSQETVVRDTQQARSSLVAKQDELAKALRDLRAGFEENKKLIISAVVSPYLLSSRATAFQRGDIIKYSSVGSPQSSFVVINPVPLNQAKREFTNLWDKELGLRPVESPPDAPPGGSPPPR